METKVEENGEVKINATTECLRSWELHWKRDNSRKGESLPKHQCAQISDFIRLIYLLPQPLSPPQTGKQIKTLPLESWLQPQRMLPRSTLLLPADYSCRPLEASNTVSQLIITKIITMNLKFFVFTLK